jgi:hypothetical protein
MVPSIDMQLQSVIKSLVDNVVPAVDPANKTATEQVQLGIAILNIVRDRLPLTRRFARAELTDKIDVADRLTAALSASGISDAANLKSLAAASRALLLDPVCDTNNLERQSFALNNAISIAIANAQETESASVVMDIVLSNSANHAWRLRSWFLAAGYEINPRAIPAIEELI